MKTNPKPVLFLAFANEQQEGARYLRNLPKELTLIRQALEPAESAGICEVVIQPNARIEDIIDTFQNERYRGRIAVFHYGGHADGFQLLLESLEGDSVIAHGEGLVSFLGNQPGLQFIFLNGCSTQQQAEELLEEGVPAVIGTAQSIADDQATQLAVRFYKGLGRGLALKHSWRQAVDEQRMRIGGDNTRGIALRDKTKTDRFPWNLYIRDGAENVEEWNLPSAAHNPLFGLPPLPPMDLPEEPYRFLDRYRREHAPVFFGRSYYIRDLFERANDPTSAPLILLHGQSGVGKSSMLEAGLFPRLESVCQVIELRRDARQGLPAQLREALSTPTSEDPDAETVKLQAELNRLEQFARESVVEIRPEVETLIRQLQQRLQALQHRSGSGSLREQWLQREARYGKPLVLILDQVEEAITHPLPGQPEELERLLDDLKIIFDDPHQRPKGKVILSYRKEYHPELLTACKDRRLPREELFLEPLSRADVMEVVTGLTSTPQLRRAYRLEVEDHLPAAIADHLLSDKNAPVAPILQILLTKLWRLDSTAGHPCFTIDGFNQLLKEGVLLDDFFQQQLDQLRRWNAEAEDSGLVLDILNFHTTNWRTAGERSLEELRKRYEHRQDLLEQLIGKVTRLYLMTESGKGQVRLAHDTLAPLVQREMKNSDRPGQRALRILENKVEAFARNPDTYLDLEDLQIVEEGQSGMRLWMPKEKELVEKSRRRRDALLAERRRNRRFKRGAVAALAVFALVISVLAFRAYRQSEANRLVSQALEAEKTDATQALRLAEAAVGKTPGNPAVRQVLARLFGNHEFYRRALPVTAALRGVALSPDGGELAAVDEKGVRWTWSADGDLLDTLTAHSGGALDIAYSPDGRFLLTCGEDKLAKLWDRGGRLIQTYEGHQSAVHAVAFSGDGSQLLTGSRDGIAIRWSVDGDTLQTYRGHGGTVYSVSFSPDGQHILTGSEDATAILWALDGNRLQRFNGHDDRVLSVAFSGDGATLLTGSRDKSAILWDTTGRQLLRLLGHEARINRVLFSPGRETYFTAGDDRRITEWNRQGVAIHTYQGHNNYINDLALSADGRLLLSAGEDHSLKLWSLNGKTYREIRHSEEAIGAAVLSPDGQWLATAGYRAYTDPIEEEFDTEDKSQDIKLWDLGGNLLQTFSGHSDGILSLAFSPDGQWLLSGAKDGTARLWKIDTAQSGSEATLELQVHDREVAAVAFAPDGRGFLTAGADSTARLWTLAGDSVAVFRGHDDWVLSAAFSPDGKQLFTGSYDQTLRRWSVRRPEADPLIFEGHTAAVTALSCSPDGRHILTGGEDNTARLWNTEGELLLNLQQLDQNLSGMGAVLSVCFDSNGEKLALAGTGGGAQIFDLEGGLLQQISASEKNLRSISFTDDGRFILTAGDDGNARLTYQAEGFLETGLISPLIQ